MTVCPYDKGTLPWVTVLGKGIVEEEVVFDFAALGTAVSFTFCLLDLFNVTFGLFILPLDILFVF
jgi:hypothetical protein